MELVHCCSQRTFDEQKENNVFGEKEIQQQGYLPFSTWNSFRLLVRNFYNKQEPYVLVIVDHMKVSSSLTWETDAKGHRFPHIHKPIPMEYITCIPFLHDGKQWLNPKTSTYILMNTCLIDAPWCFPVLKKQIQKEDEVCVFAFSFFDDTKTIEDWNRQYKPGQGIYYKSNTDVFFRYGIKKEQIHWVNYFQDTKVEMENKILNSSIIFFTGGAPDLMMKRIREFKLTSLLKNYQGIMMGYSAGAMMQLDQYHITPDDDYPTFTYEQGLGCLSGFAIEPHYRATKLQKESIQKVREEKHKSVYAIYEDGGMMINNQKIELFGNVDVFEMK